MANLFWGVSDALDLYGEYIEAKECAIKSIASIVQQNADNIKKSRANERTNDEDINGKNEKDPLPEGHNTNVDIKCLNASNEIINSEETPIDTDTVNNQAAENDKGIIEEYQEYVCNKSSRGHETENRSSSNPVIVISEERPRSEESVLEHNTQTSELFVSHNENEDIKEQDVENENAGVDENNPSVDNADDSSEKHEQSNENITTLTEISPTLNINGSESSTIACEDTSKGEHIQKEICASGGDAEAERIDYKNAKIFPDKERVLFDSSENNSPPSSCEYEKNDTEFTPNVLKILIYGGGDPRHIIKTIAKRYTHCESEGTAASLPTLKFFIIDGCMEIVARNILLLGIALEKPEVISLRNKVHLFMDIYGNSLLRPICHMYLASKALTLIKMVSDSATLEKIAPIIHIDNLKYRELDALQDAFEFWQPKPGYDFNIKDYWMSRLRRLLAVRYDAREGVFDWDLNMSLKDRGGEQICSQEYRYWRETGIAFTFPEYEQCKPNKTLSAGLVRNGGRYLHRGYIGDIQTGPFCTFGLRSMEERMHRSAHGENDYRATDVTERNLIEYFYEIQNGKEYVHNHEISKKYGSVRFQMGERLIYNECDMDGVSAYDQPWLNIEGIEVHFLSLHEVHEIGKGAPKWKEFFDMAFIGYKYFDFLTDTFEKVLRENSFVIFETKLRSVEIKKCVTDFENYVKGFANEANFINVLNYNALNSKNSILKFWKPQKSVQAAIRKTT